MLERRSYIAQRKKPPELFDLRAIAIGDDRRG